MILKREPSPILRLRFTDIISFCFSILGLYGLVYYLRFLIPRNVLLCLSSIGEAEHLLDRAESIGVIPQPNAYRSDQPLR